MWAFFFHLICGCRFALSKNIMQIFLPTFHNVPYPCNVNYALETNYAKNRCDYVFGYCCYELSRSISLRLLIATSYLNVKFRLA